MNKIATMYYDKLKWFLAILIVVSGIGGYYYLTDEPLYLRLIGFLVIAGVAFGVILQTDKGHQFWTFCQEAKLEVRKMIWPARQETIQVTLVVLGAVFVMSIFLWVVDILLFRLMSIFTS